VEEERRRREREGGEANTPSEFSFFGKRQVESLGVASSLPSLFLERAPIYKRSPTGYIESLVTRPTNKLLPFSSPFFDLLQLIFDTTSLNSLEMLFDNLAELLLLVSSVAHVWITPYTKVEESFTLHAVRDLLLRGVSKDAVSQVSYSRSYHALIRTLTTPE